MRVRLALYGVALCLCLAPILSAQDAAKVDPKHYSVVSENDQVRILKELAQHLSVGPATVQGACSPTKTAPYMQLDLHCWEIMKKQLPQRGPTAVSPIVAAATLLALWFQRAGLGNPTQAQAKQVLATINLTDPNASRSIQNTSWLQGRAGGQIVLNPAEISKAIKLAKCFCSKDWSAWKETAKS